LREGYTINSSLDFSGLIGKNMKDENNREIGRITSFLIDPFGRVEEVLVEDRHGKLVSYEVERLKIDQDEVSLTSHVDKKMALLSERFPVMRKKRKVLDRLSDNKVIPQEIYQNLCKEFDKALKEMKSEAQNLLEDMDKQVKAQEDYIKMLQLARAFLEIEHGIGTVEDEVYQQSIMSLLKEVKNASQRKLSLLRTKDEVSSILLGEEEEPEEEPQAEPTAEPETEREVELETTPVEAESASKTESTEEKPAIPVRVTQE
jgi:hypothetical protein